MPSVRNLKHEHHWLGGGVITAIQTNKQTKNKKLEVITHYILIVLILSHIGIY